MSRIAHDTRRHKQGQYVGYQGPESPDHPAKSDHEGDPDHSQSGQKAPGHAPGPGGKATGLANTLMPATFPWTSPGNVSASIVLDPIEERHGRTASQITDAHGDARPLGRLGS